MKEIHRSPVDSSHKGEWRGGLIISLICAYINGWANNRNADLMIRHCAHYDITVWTKFHTIRRSYDNGSSLFLYVISICGKRPFGNWCHLFFFNSYGLSSWSRFRQKEWSESAPIMYTLHWIAMGMATLTKAKGIISEVFINNVPTS